MDRGNQIQALLTGKALQFACESLGVSSMIDHSYSEVFDVSRSEIDAYIAEYGLPLGQVFSREGAFDGLYFIERNGNWHVYVQERGCIVSEQEFRDEGRARTKVVDILLGFAGTGLSFE